jgi:DNA-binding GntR family transcriptional regulator
LKPAAARTAQFDRGLEPLGLPETLGERAATVLRERILSGAFQPGERLVEAEIARQLGISRGPVREALGKLRAEGLVRDEPRRGSFVARLTDEDIQEIYELRAAIEAYAARLIIQRGDNDAVAQLREIGDGLREAAANNDRERFARLDFTLHEELTRLSGNRRLHDVFVTHAGVLAALLVLEITTQYESLDELLEEHERLLEGIASMDEARAEASCRRHLGVASERVAAMVREHVTLDERRRENVGEQRVL